MIHFGNCSKLRQQEPGFELLHQTGIFCEPSMKEPVSYIGGIPYGDTSMSHQQVIIPIPGG